MIWDALPKRFFSDEMIDKLLKDCRIESHLREAVHERLEVKAVEWYYCEKSEEMDLSQTDMKKSLNDLSSDLDKLADSLKALPDAVWTTIVGVSGFVDLNPSDSKVEFTTPNFPERELPGLLIITLPDAESATSGQTIEINTLIEALEVLGSAADVSAQIFPKLRFGPKNRIALSGWIIDMQNLWDSVLDRPFTRLEHDGEPTSPAAVFCVSAYAVLDPDTETRTVLGKMKTQITADNNLLKKYPHWRKTKK